MPQNVVSPKQTRATIKAIAQKKDFFLVGFKNNQHNQKTKRVLADFENQKEMASNAKNTGGGGSGFRVKLEHYLYSGDKKHVVAGIAIIGVIVGVPWYFMSRGSKHQSHQDYMDRADKARRERLSKG